jgi:hypothetical protein
LWPSAGAAAAFPARLGVSVLSLDESSQEPVWRFAPVTAIALFARLWRSVSPDSYATAFPLPSPRFAALNLLSRRDHTKSIADVNPYPVTDFSSCPFRKF